MMTAPMDLTFNLLILMFAFDSWAAAGINIKSAYSDNHLDNADAEKTLFIEVHATPENCIAKINGRYVIYAEKRVLLRKYKVPADNALKEGLHLVSVNPHSRAITGHVFSHGNIPNGAYFAAEEFYENIQHGQIVIFCVLGEAAISLDRAAMKFFARINSSYMPGLQARSPLAMILVKGERILAEGYSLNLDAVNPYHVGYRLHLAARFQPPEKSECQWKNKPNFEQRKDFCEKYDGYRYLCDCSRPQHLPIHSQAFEDGSRFSAPIIIVASNRPRYLHRCLTTLLANTGLDISRTMVYVDGEYAEVQQLLTIMNVPFHQHIAETNDVVQQNIGTKIAHNYKYAILHAFEKFKDADRIVILEEDLEVSPDFVSFFRQTQYLLDKDISLYCISAWNDHGYNHSSADPHLLYRVGYMPGLGWMMKKDILLEEIFPEWPSEWKVFDWDVLLRLPNHRRGRDCVIPDISRTYHFGFEGNHVNAGMQFKFFFDHAFNTLNSVTLANTEKMIYPRYRAELIRLIKQAKAISGPEQQAETTCSQLIPDNSFNSTYILFITMNNSEDISSWQKISTCLNLWDLDVRGDYKGIWRFWLNKNHVLVMGIPYSDLSSLALQLKGDVFVFSGSRTAKEARLGRWPPNVHRETDFDKRKKLLLSYNAYNQLDID